MIGLEHYVGSILACPFGNTRKGEQPIMFGSGNGLWIRITLPGAPDEYWLAGTVEPAPEGADEVSLESEGWLRVDEAQLLCFLGQLSAVRVLEQTEEPTRFYVRQEEASGPLLPVALVHALPETVRRNINAFFEPEAMPNVLPVAISHAPPWVGEAALVAKEDGWHLYRLAQLGYDVQALWRALDEDLRALAEPADWFLWTPLLVQAIEDAAGIERERAELEAALLESSGKTRGKMRRRRLNEQRQALLIAQEQAEKIRTWQERKQQDQPAWEQRWKAAQHKARELASAYEAFASQATAGDDLAPSLMAIIPPERTLQVGRPDEEPRAIAQPRRKHNLRGQYPDLVRRDPPAVPMQTDVITNLIMRGLLNKTEYQKQTRRGKEIAVYRAPLAKGKGELTITISPGESQPWDVVGKSLDVLGDEVVDTYCALLALALDRFGSSRLDEPFFLNPDDILHICQRRQSNGAFTPPQRARVIEHLQVLNQAHVLASMPGSRPGHEYRAESAILDLLPATIGEYRTATGATLWERREVKWGRWVQMVPKLSDQTAMMLRRILQYHPQRERFAKRLGRFVSLQEPSQGYLVLKLRTWLREAGIQPDPKHPTETLASFKEALDTLKHDGVIAGSAPIVESIAPAHHKRIAEHAYGWWELCELQEWRIDLLPPDEQAALRPPAPSEC
jgi:hypothetical protein